MKKLFSLFAAMMLTVVSFAADVTVYFHNTEGWTSVYAYAWTPNNAGWPGEKMSPTNMENYFAYELTGDQKNIIFTNGTGTQTANLTVEAGRCFEWVNGTTTTSWTDAPEGIQIGESGPVVTETIDVTVRVYTEEAAPKIWWWGGGIAGADATYTWDGRPSLEKEGETNWYAWTFAGVNKDLGISYKITATGEREFTNVMVDNCYDANLDLLDCNYAPSTNDTVPGPGPEPTDVTYYIKNGWNGGDWTWEEMTANADKTEWTYTNVFGGTGVNINTESSDAGATWFAVAAILGDEIAAGDSVTFTYNVEDKTVTAVKLSEGDPTPGPGPEPEVYTYYLTGNETLFAAMGKEGSWNPDAFGMKDGSITFTAPAGDYAIKVTKGDWTYAKGYSDLNTEASSEGLTTDGKDNNILFTVEVENDVTVSIADDKVTVVGTFKKGEPGPEPTEGIVFTVTVPEGTPACYIAGNLNTWSFTEMTKVDDTHYTITLTDATNAQGYKYCSGPDWAYVEKDANGAEIGNRSYAANDVVAKWASVYAPGAAITYVTFEVWINFGNEAPTIWWWGAGSKCPNAENQSYSWPGPQMEPAGVAGWYKWTFTDVQSAFSAIEKDPRESAEFLLRVKLNGGLIPFREDTVLPEIQALRPDKDRFHLLT